VASYRLLIKPSAAKEIEKVRSTKERRKIVQKIRTLADDPRPPGCQKLRDRALYRLRQGRFRIVYSVEDETLTVLVVKVGDRKEVYKGNF
jgi:mRNA interferase RelE/StbE